MLLDDFKALLWHFGGNLGRGSGVIAPETADNPELFLLTAANFLSVDARLTTCIFNIVIEIAPQISSHDLEKQLTLKPYDLARLGVLVSIVREELQRRGHKDVADKWISIENQLHSKLPAQKIAAPLLPHLPRLPGWRDPIFLSWGFDYPGIIREPRKYLRRAV